MDNGRKALVFLYILGKYHTNCAICRRFNVVLKDEQDMQQALGTLTEFSTFSGLETNRMKSEAMWLGTKQNCTDTFFGFVWKRRLKILGVYFACDKCASQVEENWTGRAENIKRIINAWGKRKPENCWQSLHYKNIFNFTVCIYYVCLHVRLSRADVPETNKVWGVGRRQLQGKDNTAPLGRCVEAG